MTEQSMMQRVRFAIRAKALRQTRGITSDDLVCVDAEVAARAAIEAMREPTQAMISAGYRVPGEGGFGEARGEPPEPDSIYAAMISEALK